MVGICVKDCMENLLDNASDTGIIQGLYWNQMEK